MGEHTGPASARDSHTGKQWVNCQNAALASPCASPAKRWIVSATCTRQWSRRSSRPSRYLLKSLYADEHLVDTFYVLDSADEADKDVRALVEMARPLQVQYVNASSDVEAMREVSATGGRLMQFGRLAVCLELVEAAGATRGQRYDWLIRSRPDLCTFGPLPSSRNP